MSTVTIDERKVAITQDSAPTTGSTVNIASWGYVNLVINPAGAILALTLNFPSSPQDGDTINFCTTQTITTLSITGGTLVGALSTLLSGSFGYYVYNSTTSKWVRMG